MLVMLLAVEGGGFFSSSASGYTKGISLLLSGRTATEDRPRTPMRVSPWNHFHLLDQHHLAPKKKIKVRRRGCAPFFCFRRTSGDGQLPPKAGPTRQLDGLPEEPAVTSRASRLCAAKEEAQVFQVCLKSSLKKIADCSTMGRDEATAAELNEEEDGDDTAGCSESRKVHWTDACGRELAEIREFEVSEAGPSDDELDGNGGQSCLCWI